MPTQTVTHAPSNRRTVLWAATVALLVLAAACYWYATEHRSHLAQAATWLLILACPLMHLFGHRHGGAHGGGAKAGEVQKPSNEHVHH